MPPKTDEEAAGATGRTPPPAGVTPAFLKDVLQKSTQASQQATQAMQDTLAALPELLAQALAARPAAPAAPAATPRSLHDRKVPDFWESKPTSWFHVFESHLDANNAAHQTEQGKFSLLLPLLTTGAVNKVDRLVRAPPANVYTVAKEKLLSHFERDLMDMVAELASLSSFGDMSAVDFLEYMRSLQPGEAETRLFRHIFVRSMPGNISSVVAHHNDLDDMAKAADVAIKAMPSTASTDPVLLSASALSADHPRDKLVDGLCAIHAKYGKESYHCLLSACKMKNIVKKKPGNAPAGRK